MSNAILPAICTRLSLLVRVLNEPIVDVSEQHSVTWCFQQSFVDELGIWLVVDPLLLISHAVTDTCWTL